MMERFFQLDGNILLWIQQYIRCDLLTPFFRFFTTLGEGGAIWIAIAIMLFFIKKYRKTGVMVGVSLLGSLIFINMIIKNLVARARPYKVIETLTILVPEPKEFSFPSGHAASSFAAGVVLYLTLPKKYGVPALILAVLISLSRLYVGVHYPTDVLGGMVMGPLIAVAVVKGWQLVERKKVGK